MADTVIRWIGDHCFVMAIDASNDRAAILRRSKAVGGTYAAKIADRLCDSYLFGLRDLLAEYEKYFELEYPKVEQYLYVRYGLSEDDITELLSDMSPSRRLVLGDECANGDYMLSQLFESEIGYSMLRALLSLKNVPNTDSEEEYYED